MALATETEIHAAYQGDDVAKRYVADRFLSPLHRLLHGRQVEAVQRTMDTIRPPRVLEIAPGPGRLTRALRPPGSLTCLEFNEGMIREGRRSCPPAHCNWVRGNGFQLPFAAVFDLVYSFRFIRHFHREDRERLYEEIRRVLYPGGWLIFDAVNERISRPMREADPTQYPIYDKLYRADELQCEMNAAGFSIVSMQPVQKFWGLQSRSQVLLGPRANWLNRLVIHTLERMPRRDGLEWIVMCRRA